MHKSEWLSDAERVPVGQNRRVYHGAETRPNLVVWNSTDSWSAYCHACHESARVYKEVIQPVADEPPKFQKYLSSSDCCTFSELALRHPEKYRRLVLFLHKKCMSTALLLPYEPLYNCTDDRVVLGFNGAYIGRDVTERHPAKWFKYYSDVPMDFMYLQGQKIGDLYEPIALTEDLFSAIKIHQYTGMSALWCSGTHISDAIISFLTYPRSTCPLYPILAFDGDKAGDRAKRDASKRLGIRGVKFESVRVPDGLDPKDLNHVQLNNLFNSLGENHGYSSSNT